LKRRPNDRRLDFIDDFDTIVVPVLNNAVKMKIMRKEKSSPVEK